MTELPTTVPPVNTDQRFTASVVLDVKTKDGQPFFAAELKYSDFPYAGVVLLEREVVTLAGRLTEYGEAAVAGKTTATPAGKK